jgi:anti-sigma factor RsiW
MNHDETHVRDHDVAIAEMTAERYLLGTLSDDEADAFEQHYFDCRVCADTIRAGAAMLAAGREVVKSEQDAVPAVKKDLIVPQPVAPVLPFRQRLRQSMSLAAAAVLAVVLTYQGFIIPRLQTAAQPLMQITTLTPLVHGTARGAADAQVQVVPAGAPIVLSREIPTEPKYPHYRFELRDASGKLLGSENVSDALARTGDPISLSVRPLPAGGYVLSIVGVREGGNRSTVVDSWRVDVQ